MSKCIRGFDINRRIAIPRVILEALGIDYTCDTMIITIVGDKIVLEKEQVEDEDIRIIRRD